VLKPCAAYKDKYLTITEITTESSDVQRLGLSLSGGGTRGIITLRLLILLIKRVYGDYTIKTHKLFLNKFTTIAGSSSGR
jgi:hypothetical protein